MSEAIIDAVFPDQLTAALTAYVEEYPRYLSRFRSLGARGRKSRIQSFSRILKDYLPGDFAERHLSDPSGHSPAPWHQFSAVRMAKAELQGEDNFSVFGAYVLDLLGDALSLNGSYRTDIPDAIQLVSLQLARYFSGAENAEIVQMFATNLIPTRPVKLFEDWELSAISIIRDARMPLPQPSRVTRSVMDWDGGFLRRTWNAASDPISGSMRAERELVWPLLFLNLLSHVPVGLGHYCFVEPGRSRVELVPDRGRYGLHRAPEQRRWGHPITNDWWRRRHRIDEAATDEIEVVARLYGNAISRLDRWRADQLTRAADQFLTVTFRGNWLPRKTRSVETEEADDIFRLIAAIEGILTGEDRDHGELTRKVAQRAAILIGRSPEDRILVHQAVRSAYAARSAYVHGSKPKGADVAGVRDLARRILLAWPLATSEHEKGRLSTLLDEALLSPSIYAEQILRATKPVLIAGAAVEGSTAS